MIAFGTGNGYPFGGFVAGTKSQPTMLRFVPVVNGTIASAVRPVASTAMTRTCQGLAPDAPVRMAPEYVPEMVAVEPVASACNCNPAGRGCANSSGVVTLGATSHCTGVVNDPVRARVAWYGSPRGTTPTPDWSMPICHVPVRILND